MSKNGGICSVKSKKKYKNFFWTSIMPHMPHLGITRITMSKPLIYKASRRFCNEMVTSFLVSPTMNPYVTMVCGVFQWNHRISTDMRKISNEVRGLCCDYAGHWKWERSPNWSLRKHLPMSASSVQLNAISANPLYYANLYIILLYVIVCLCSCDVITRLNEWHRCVL